jgi:bacteriorhodopsin
MGAMEYFWVVLAGVILITVIVDVVLEAKGLRRYSRYTLKLLFILIVVAWITLLAAASQGCI